MSSRRKKRYQREKAVYVVLKPESQQVYKGLSCVFKYSSNRKGKLLAYVTKSPRADSLVAVGQTLKASLFGCVGAWRIMILPRPLSSAILH